MDNAKMGVFHTQLFRFWYCMGFLPYLGLDDDSVMADSLVRLLRALEKQQPEGNDSSEDSIKDIAAADWSIKNIMLDCVDKAESMLSLCRPSSTSLDARLVEISIALASLLDKAREVQDPASNVTQKTDQKDPPFSRVPPHPVNHAMVPPPTASCPPPLPPPGFSRPFNRGLPPGSGICSPAPPAWTRPEFNSDHASSGSIYKNTPSNIHTSNYMYLYYNGVINGPSPTPPPPSRLPPSPPPPYPMPRPGTAGPGLACPPPRRTLATLRTMREEYFCAVYDSSSVHRDALFDKIRHIVPEGTFTYASSLHPSSFKAVVCCVAGWGLGNSAHALAHDRLQGLDYAQLVRMVMLSGETLYYTSSEIYKSTRPQPQPPQILEPSKISLFSGITPPGAAQGPAKPPLFKVAYDDLCPSPPGPRVQMPYRHPMSSGYEPPVRPHPMNPAFRKPGPTGSVGRPALYHPPQPYSLPPGSRYGPMPVMHGVPPWRGGPVPSRKDQQNRWGKKSSKGTRRSIFDNDDDASKDNKSESGSEGSIGNSDSEYMDRRKNGSESGSGSDSGSDSDSPSVRRERRLLRRLSYSSLYTDSVLSDDDGKDKAKDDEDNEFKDDSEACTCLYGKGRRSKKCNSPRCIYDDMTDGELEKAQKHAQKIRAKRQHSKAVVAAWTAEKEQKKAAKAKAEKEEQEREQQQKEKEKKEKQDKKNRKSKLDNVDWQALSDGLSDSGSGSDSNSNSDSSSDSDSDKGDAAKRKAIESGSVVSLSESGFSSGSASESDSESKTLKMPSPGPTKVDIFAWMKEGKPSKESKKVRQEKEKEKAKKKDEKDQAKRRGSFVFI